MTWLDDAVEQAERANAPDSEEHAPYVSPERFLALAEVVKAADKAALQYGASKGRLVPEMEQLGHALARLDELET